MEALFKKLHRHVLRRDDEDVMSWWVSKKGLFIVKSFYSSLVPCNGTKFPSSIVCNPWVPKRVNFFYLGSNLGENSKNGSTKKEGLAFTNQVLFV